MKNQSITKGFAILSVSTLLVKFISIAYNPILNKIIGEEAFGIYLSTYIVFACVFIIVSAGIPVAISKLVAEYSAMDNYVAIGKTFSIARNLMFIISLVLTLFLILISGPLAHFIKTDGAAMPIAIIAPSVFFASMSYAYRSYFQGMRNMIPTAVSSLVEQIVNVILSLVGAFILIRFSISWGVVGGTIGTTIGAFVSLQYLLNKKKKLKFNGEMKKEVVRKRRSSTDVKIFRQILRISIPLMICMGLTYFGDNILDVSNVKGRLLENGYTAKEANIMYGNLGKTTQLINVPVTLITSLSYSTLPSITMLIAAENIDEANKKIKYAFKLCFMITIPFAIAFSFLSKSIFGVLSFSSYKLIMFGAYNLIFMSLVQLQIVILQSIGKLYQLTAFLLIGVACKFIINYFAVSNEFLNIYGALIGMGVGSLVTFILNYMYLREKLKINFSLIRLSLKPLISSLAMGGAGILVNKIFLTVLLKIGIGYYFSNALALMVTVIVCIVVYVVMVYILKGFENDDLDLLPARVVGKIPKQVLMRIENNI